jgi:hypothetical protein
MLQILQESPQELGEMQEESSTSSKTEKPMELIVGKICNI